MPNLFTNNATATLPSSITSSATSITVTSGQGAAFPTTSSGTFYVTLFNSGGTYEIAKCTGRTGDTFTVVRGQEGTSASAFASGDKMDLRITAAGLNNFAQYDQINTFTAANTFTSTVTSSGATLVGSWAGAPTFSGAVVLSGTPSFTSGAALNTGTYSGNATFSGNLTLTGVTAVNNQMNVAASTKVSLNSGLNLSHNGTNGLVDLATGDMLVRTAGGSTLFTFSNTSGNFTALGNLVANSGSSTMTVKPTGLLFPDNTTQTTSALGTNLVVLTSSTTWTVPAGVNKILVGVWGAGGGGGGGSGYNSITGGMGGGGAVGVALITGLTPGTGIGVTVGTGGAGGTGSNIYQTAGAAGGTSSFGSVATNGTVYISCTGGTGGAGGAGWTGIPSTPGVATFTGVASKLGQVSNNSINGISPYLTDYTNVSANGVMGGAYGVSPNAASTEGGGGGAGFSSGGTGGGTSNITGNQSFGPGAQGGTNSGLTGGSGGSPGGSGGSGTYGGGGGGGGGGGVVIWY